MRVWFRYLARTKVITLEDGQKKRQFVPAGWVPLEIENSEQLYEFTRPGIFTATGKSGPLKGVILDLTVTPLLDEPFQ